MSSDPLGRPQPSGVKLDEAQRFVGLIATGAWALVGLTVYTAIVFYMGWRVGVVEGELLKRSRPRTHESASRFGLKRV